MNSQPATSVLAKCRKQRRASLLTELRARGFDGSYRVYSPTIGHSARVKCSQCEALVINGVATHETGCPHIVHECKGCNATVSREGAYCPDCS
jgi:Pyruvate/2-oxoacid:ferredoxin oxidoreductase delta subunit